MLIFFDQKKMMEKRDLERDQWIQKLFSEIISLNISLRVSIEEFKEEMDNETPFYSRKASEVPIDQDPHLVDENKQQEDIFFLNVQKEYLIKVDLCHQILRKLPFGEIVGIEIKPPDCDPVTLKEMKFIQMDDNEYKAKALLKLSSFASKALATVSPKSGPISERYVPLRVFITIMLDESNQTCFTIEQKIHVRMFEMGDSMLIKRAVDSIHEKWVSFPLCLKRGIKLVSNVTHLTTTLSGLNP